MEANLNDFLDEFSVLGGVATNIYQKLGDNGRGIFPIDSLKNSKIMTPENLLVDSDNLGISQGEIMIKDKTRYSQREVAFLETYYNEFSWGNNGNSDSATFLQYIRDLPESIKRKLLDNRFIDKKILSFRDNEDHLLKRFIDERTVGFASRKVLAPVWEFVNHSSFAAPLRITPYGIETPPIEACSAQEILQKYGKMQSPIGIWKKYGFACDCIVAYSIPFNIHVDVSNQAFTIKCSGHDLGPGPKNKRTYFAIGNILTIKSLPVGCLSLDLPRENFKSILSSFNFSEELVNRLLLKVREINLQARRDIIESLKDKEQGTFGNSELYKALIREIDLIESSSTS